MISVNKKAKIVLNIINYRKILSKKASSSIGRASVSKTEGWGFDALLACHIEMVEAEFLTRE